MHQHQRANGLCWPPIIDSASSQEVLTMTQQKVAARDDSSPSAPSAICSPKLPTRTSSLNFDQHVTVNSQVTGHTTNDEAKSQSPVVSDASGPRVAQMVEYRPQDPFAKEHQGGVQYRTMSWWQAGMVMIAETVSLGVLSLPSALSTLGLIPGLILLVSLGLLSTYSGYLIGQFKQRHPHIYSMADAGTVLFGRVGGEVLGIGQLLFFIFTMGSHILTFSIAMNALTSHVTCTVAFMAAGTALSFILTIPRTLKNLSWWSITSFISIIAAVIITMVGVIVFAPSEKLGSPAEVAFWPSPQTPFHTAFLAVANIVFAYAGHVAFFAFISELRHPEEFPKALFLLQGCDMCLYVVSSVVIYYFAGRLVKSPALDSTAEVIRKVAYGVALPTIVVAGVVNGHVAVKYLYVRLLRNKPDGKKSNHDEHCHEKKEEGGRKNKKEGEGNLMYQTNAKAWGIWIAINACVWLLAWIIAEGVPVFNDLLGLTSALFSSWFTFGLSGFFWLNLNKSSGSCWWQQRCWRGNLSKIFGGMVALGLSLVGAGICIMGLYASSVSIRENSLKHTAGGPFSCADNSAHARIVGELDGGKID